MNPAIQAHIDLVTKYADGEAWLHQVEASAKALAAPTAPAPTEPVGREPALKWCSACGEGVTTFCRAPKRAIINAGCPMFATPPSAAAQPEAVGELLCGICNGSGWMVRDSDIGTDQECFACDGVGKFSAPTTEATSSPSDADIDYSIKAGASIHQALTMKRFQRIKKPQALTYEVTV